MKLTTRGKIVLSILVSIPLALAGFISGSFVDYLDETVENNTITKTCLPDTTLQSDGSCMPQE